MNRATAVSCAGVLTVAIQVPGPALAHLPHDVMAEVAVAGWDPDRIVAQYACSKRRMIVVSEDGGSTWTYHAPPEIEVDLQSLRFAAPDVLFAADGVQDTPLVSEDGGHTWRSTAAPDGGAVLLVEPSPAFEDDPTVFAATEGGQAYRSDDGGDQWAALLDSPGSDVVELLVSPDFPTDPFLALVTRSGEMAASSDGGSSWAVWDLPDGTAVPLAMALSPDFPVDDRLWIGTDGGELLSSADRGSTWEVLPVELDGVFLDDRLSDLVALSADRLLAVGADHAVLCSDDGGFTWDLCDEGLPATAGQAAGLWRHNRRLERPVHGPEPVALAAWEGLIVSEDGGHTWEERCVLHPDYIRGVAFSPAYPDDPSLLVGSYGSGLYTTRDGGQSWEVSADRQIDLFLLELTLSPRFPDDGAIFLMADRTLYRSEDGGETFVHEEMGEIYVLLDVDLSPDFAADRTGFALGTTHDPGQWVVERTEDGGASWQTAHVCDPPPAPQIVDLEVSPRFAETGAVYAIQDDPPGVLRSVDRGVNWEEIGVFPGEGRVVALFAESEPVCRTTESESEYLVAVTAGGEVWRTSAGEWEEGSHLGRGVLMGARATRPIDGGAAERRPLFLLLDPTGVVRSDDGGRSWETIPTPFASPVFSVDVPPRYPDDPTVVVTTHYGAFFTCDDGENWHLLTRAQRFENDACPLRYRGDGWVKSLGSGTGLRVTRSSTPGDSMELEFWGRAVRWLGTGGTGSGVATIHLDGESVGEVHLTEATPGEPGVLFEHDLGWDGLHSLRIEVEGGGFVEIDAIEIERHEVRNGAFEAYGIGEWCIDLAGTEPPLAEVAANGSGCAATHCEVGPHGALRSGTAALLAGIAWVLLVTRRRGRVRRGLIFPLFLAVLVHCSACHGGGDVDLVPPGEDPRVLEHYLLAEDESNHLLPLHLDVDPVSRRAWCISRLLGTVAQIDLDSAQVLRVLPRFADSVNTPRLVGDGPDRFWLARSSAPALVRVDADTGEMSPLDVDLEAARALLRLDDDRLLVAATRGDGADVLMVLDGAGEVADELELDEAALGLEALDGDRFAVLMRTDHVEVRDAHSLSRIESCPLSIDVVSTDNHFAALSTGDFVVSADAGLGLAVCGGGEPVEAEGGTENRAVVAIGDEALVLDRIGGAEPNWGEMRRYDADLAETGETCTTGKNSGYGGMDTETGLFWMNSEGSTEVWAIDAESHEVVHRVPTGVHVESVALDPARPGSVLVSGRLSDTLCRVDLSSGEVVTGEIDFHWPVRPLVHGGGLWVLDHLEGVLHVLDPETLAGISSIELGEGGDRSLTLADAAVHPGRGTLFVAHGGANVLVEVDLDEGAVVGRWELGGELLDRDEAGRLEVLIRGDELLTVRTADGRITRIDPQDDEPLATAAPVADLLPGQTRLQLSALSANGALLYIGKFAIDVATLDRKPGKDRDWTFAVAQQGDTWIAWRGEDAMILLVDDDGGVLRTLATDIPPGGAQAPEFLWAPEWEDRLVYTDMRRAGVVALPIRLE